MTKRRKRPVDTAAIAVHYGVAVGTVRRWASEDEWLPMGTRRHRLWDLNQAQDSYDKRHPREDG